MLFLHYNNPEFVRGASVGDKDPIKRKKEKYKKHTVDLRVHYRRAGCS